MNQVAGLLESTYGDLRVAISAKQSGNLRRAMELYLAASKNLFEAAKQSPEYFEGIKILEDRGRPP